MGLGGTKRNEARTGSILLQLEEVHGGGSNGEKEERQLVQVDMGAFLSFPQGEDDAVKMEAVEGEHEPP